MNKRLGIKVPKKAISFSGLIWPYWSRLILGSFLTILLKWHHRLIANLNQCWRFNISKASKVKTSFFWLFFRNYQNLFYSLSHNFLGDLWGLNFGILSRVVIFGVGRSIERDARKILFYQLSIFDDPFFSAHPVGDLMNHLTNDISNIRMVAGFAILNIMNIILIFLFTIPMLFVISDRIGFCALVPFPLVIISMSGLSKRLFATSKAYQEKSLAKWSATYKKISLAPIS